MKKLFVLLLLCFLFVGRALAFDQLVVFGDSLSDLGFQDELGSVTGKAPVYTTPGGQAWPFYLAHDLGLPTITVNNSTAPDSKNQFVSALGEGGDYAAGGAVTQGVGIGSSTYAPPSMYAQLNRYLQVHASDNKADTLFVLLGGANDISIAMQSDDPATAVMTAAKQAADHIADQASLLLAHGAQHVVVVNLPDLGKTPLALSQPGVPELLSAATTVFNAELADKVSGEVAVFDLQQLSADMIANKQVEVNGQVVAFDNVTDSQCSFDADKGVASISAINCIPDTRVGDPVYLYADGMHPTDTAHRVLAAKLSEFVSAH